MKPKDFIEFLKLPPNILSAICLVSGIVLFIPDKFAKKIYMYEFRNNYGFIVSLVFLVSFSILIILLVTTINKYILKKYKNRKLMNKRKKYLLEVDKTKLKIIKNFIKNDTHTLKLNQNDGLTQEFLFYGMISMAGSTQTVDFGYDNEIYLYYFLQPWVIKLINENEELKKKYL